ncbi:signal peptidase I [Ectothiorhodospiraceae bacterium WFHF3C12]|nr:signal peptidase I [Ectothiorhodospiraceae bacterium WFHF3C12]
MHFDFEALLVLLTLVTGVIWAWDRFRRKDDEAQEDKGKGQSAETDVSWWVDLSRSLFPVILIVLVIRSFAVEPFRIPSGSMVPTLLTGDFILVNKFAYGLRLPVTHHRIVPIGEPDRGDVAVFRYPLDESQDYIKRIVGLPGDMVSYRDKRLYINGKLAEQQPVGAWPGPEAAQVREEVLGEVRHQILVHRDHRGQDFEYEVPARSYFVMGDNRDRSSDSRFWGAVPAHNLVGQAFFIWMSWDAEDTSVHWSRIGNAIE